MTESIKILTRNQLYYTILCCTIYALRCLASSVLGYSRYNECHSIHYDAVVGQII